MSEEWDELPEGWRRATLGEICDKPQYGYTTKAVDTPNGPRFLRTTDLKANGVNWSTVPYCGEPPDDVDKYQIYDGDLLIARAGSVGKAYRVSNPPPNVVFASYLIRFRATQALPRFVEHFLKSKIYWDQIADSSAGITIPNINASKLSQVEIPLPPLPEQQRIVEKIEQLFAESRTAREALDRVPALLKRFRQSVLAKAFRGELTERDPNDEPASVLLERIREERRRKWEEGKGVKSKKYAEPEPTDTSDLPELPEGWCWATWGQISNWITYGFTRPMPHFDEGIPIATAKNVANGRIDFANTHKTTRKAFDELSDKDRPVPGDILITKDGTIGRAAIVETHEPFCINQSVAVIWLRSCPINRQYLLAAIEMPVTQNALLEQVRGVAIQHLSVTDFGNTPFPLAPQAEQERIIAKIESLFAQAEAIEQAVEVARRRAAKVDQAVLARAFRGEL